MLDMAQPLIWPKMTGAPFKQLERVGRDPGSRGPEPCAHPTTESLGSCRDARFFRCQSCGYVLVRQGSIGWAIPPDIQSTAHAKALRFRHGYREHRRLANGDRVTLRLVQPSDAALLARGLEQLSPESRYRRFFGYKKELSQAEIEYLTDCDGINHFALGAVIERPDGSEEGVGVARFIRMQSDPLAAEAALTVVDAAQNNGLGRLLLERLLSAAAERNLRELRFYVLTDNKPMLALVRKLGTATEHRMDMQFGRPVLNVVLPVPASGADVGQAGSRPS